MINEFEQADFSALSVDRRVVPKSKPFYAFVKRLADIILSVLAVIILSPVFLVTMIVVFIQDGGNPFYVSLRRTKDGRLFRMYKFRSMIKDADKLQQKLAKKHGATMDGPAFKMTGDPRITKVGHFIRKTSIDELPQFFNVLKGDMSIVGPRPPVPEEMARYTVYQMQRMQVKQGLTCFWQCSGRSNIDFDGRTELDLKYIRERGIWTDIKILFKTVGAVVTMRGAK